MINTHTQAPAKEGLAGFITLLFLCGVFFLFDFSLLFYFTSVCLIFWVYIFRNPERFSKERLKDVFLSPCDGRIENIEYLDNQVLLTFKIGLLDVGLLRAPFDYEGGMKIDVTNGLKLYLSDNRAKEELNARIRLEGEGFSMEVVSEIFPARFYSLIDWKMGERIGFCKAGTLRLKFNPEAVDLKINIGDIVKSGETLLGYRK
ncbi:MULTISPECIES: hypothetical protein [unclassified Helicobacter]|uniref:hypothetical protein n=1 Tax=unclassified Helicobacter TaxID=2593540 RepID=UPI000CF0E277|nr:MULTISPECIES: hypothetical protein [unclassified Helicobacter]